MYKLTSISVEFQIKASNPHGNPGVGKRTAAGASGARKRYVVVSRRDTDAHNELDDFTVTNNKIALSSPDERPLNPVNHQMRRSQRTTSTTGKEQGGTDRFNLTVGSTDPDVRHKVKKSEKRPPGGKPAAIGTPDEPVTDSEDRIFKHHGVVLRSGRTHEDYQSARELARDLIGDTFDELPLPSTIPQALSHRDSGASNERNVRRASKTQRKPTNEPSSDDFNQRGDWQSGDRQAPPNTRRVTHESSDNHSLMNSPEPNSPTTPTGHRYDWLWLLFYTFPVPVLAPPLEYVS